MIALEHQDSQRVDLEKLALAFGAAGLLLAWTFPLWRAFYPFACPLKSIAGIPCAFCGGTRAVHAWAHGHLLESVMLNPLVAAAAAAATLYLPYALFCVVKRPDRRLRLRSLGGEESASVRWAIRSVAIAAVLGNWIYLIAAGR